MNVKDALEHARNLFIYSAGQRLTSIRYFFAAYAIMAVAYVNVATSDFKAVPQDECVESVVAKGLGIAEVLADVFVKDPHLVLFALSFLGAFVTLIFFGLDIRNANLVWIEEQPMNQAEQLAQQDLKKITTFNITNEWRMENGNWAKRFIFQYKTLMPLTFSVFFTLSIILMIFHYNNSCFFITLRSVYLFGLGLFFVIVAGIFIYTAHILSRGKKPAGKVADTAGHNGNDGGTQGS